MTTLLTCPDHASLRGLLEGTLPEQVQTDLHRHLDDCASCQRVLEQLAASQNSWEGVAAKLSADPPACAAPLQAVMHRLKADVSSAETQAAENSTCGDNLDFLAPSAKAGHLGRLKDYEVVQLLGKGGFGLVFKARDEALDRIVAIKVMAPPLAGNASARQRFQREARAAAAVTHEHIVGIYAVDDINGLPYFVMHYVHGVSLQERIDRSGPLELKEILRIGAQIASGLAAAHQQGLVHRDIKPANILLENGVERVKITDFGLARSVDDASVTQSGVIAGTPLFMSPEQARGEPVDHRTDLFSLGSVLYVMCTGRAPFRASGTMAVLKRVCDDTPRPIREINPDIPDWLCEIVCRLQAKNPVMRFQAATEVAKLLRQHLAHLQQPDVVPPPPVMTVQASESAPSPVDSRPARSLRSLRNPILIGLVLGGIAGAFAMSQWTVAPMGRDAALLIGLISGIIVGALVGAAVGIFLWAVFPYKANDSDGFSSTANVTGSVLAPESAATRTPKRRLWLGPIVAIVFLLIVSTWLVPMVVRFFTMGTLVVEANDAILQVVIKQNGQQVATLDTSTRQAITLPPGQYELQVICEPTMAITSFLVTTRSLFSFGESGTTMPRGGDVKEWPLKVQAGAESSVFIEVAPVSNLALEKRDDWTRLFNGKDLTGWKPHPDFPGDWKVEDGILVGSGPQRESYLFSERDDFINFHLRAEIKTNQPGDGGISCRCPHDEWTKLDWITVPTDCYEAQFAVPAVKLKTGSLLGPQNVYVAEDLIQADNWFTLELIANGRHLVVKVNGKTTAELLDPKALRSKGHLALQRYLSESVVQFRKIEIRKLSPEGWMQLFNGKDLNGWTPIPAKDGSWRVEDGILTGKGTPGNLFTDAGNFQDFHLRVEARVNNGGNSGVHFRARMGPGKSVSIPDGYEAQIDASKDVHKTGSLFKFPSVNQWLLHKENGNLIQPDTWFSHEVIAQGNRLVVKVNGQTVADVLDDQFAKGHLALQVYTTDTVVQFRKVELKFLSTSAQDEKDLPEVLRAEIALLEKKLEEVKKLVALKAAAKTEEISAEAALLEARIKLAGAEMKTAEVINLLKQLIGLQEGQLDVLRKLAPTVSKEELRLAEIGVLEVRIRLAEAEKKKVEVITLLQQVVVRVEEQVSALKKLRAIGAVTELEVLQAELQLTKTKARLNAAKEAAK